MADKYPYAIGNAGLIKIIQQLRKSFPPIVSAETIKKLGIAPNNETYLINTLKFIGVLDEEGKKTKEASSIFVKDDATFPEAFSELVKSAYLDLFSIYSTDGWTLETSKLISYFRTSDETSEVVGKRQASTFQALASLSGYSPIPVVTDSKEKLKTGKPKKTLKSESKKSTRSDNNILEKPLMKPDSKGKEIGLTVRVEINLPAVADQATYDMIFKSIRENLINGE